MFRDARPDAHQRAKVHDRREHHPVDRELLDLVEQRFAPAGVALPRLLLEQVVDVRVPAVRVAPLREDELLDAARGVAGVTDAGDFVPIPPFFTAAESVVNNLNAVGIRVKMRPVERPTFYAAWRDKKLRGIFLTAAGNSGNAASRVETFMYTKGAYAYGGYPDLDDLFVQQGRERDLKKREALLHRIQQLSIERVMFAPLMDFRALMAVGPRMAEHAINVVPMTPFPSYEDMRLKDR